MDNRSPRRGRIVMLVDNGVVNDSRVQKQATSIAARGWDVTLLGTHRAKPTRWPLGKARVVLLPVERRGRPNVRSLRWRDPVAHPSLPIARYQEIGRRARLADHDAHREAMGRASLRGRVTGASLRWRANLAQVRLAHTERAAEGRRTHANVADRVIARLFRSAYGSRAWRWLDPSLLDLELAFGPEIDRLKPDLIHANDFRTLGIAVRAKWRAARQGRNVKVVWDAHEYLPGIHPWHDDERWHDAQLAHEREYARFVDGVVTVSDELATMLTEDHQLSVAPVVVQNCPAPSPARTAVSRRLREDCDVADDVPLMVYSGSARAARGIDVMVEALVVLPEVVCAVVVSDPQSAYISALQQKARELGVLDRFKVVPYVSADEVVAYLAEATVGVIPILHYVNHEIALITKFFEYAHARLPILVSDVRAMSREVGRTGIGEVFTAGDVTSYATAARRILADPDSFRRVYEDSDLLSEWTWDEQADRLDKLYGSLTSR